MAGERFFKYIGFKNKLGHDVDYWLQPLKDETLYFSKKEELQNGNDPDEFMHTFEHRSVFFNKYLTTSIKPAYDRLFSNCRVLCVSKHFDKRCWEHYCEKGGVCLEFSMENIDHDVSHRPVVYDEKKIHSVTWYMILNSNPDLARVIMEQNSLDKLTLSRLYC